MALGVGFLGPVQLRKGPPPCQDTPSILGHPCCHSVFCRRVLGYSSCFRGVEGLGGVQFYIQCRGPIPRSRHQGVPAVYSVL